MKMIMDDIKLTYIPDSHGFIKVYIAAKDGETVEAWFNAFWNHNATSNEGVEWIFDNEGAFCTNWEKFTRAMQDIFLFSILNENEDAYKGEKGGAMPRAKELAQAKIDSKEKKDGSMRYGRIGHVYTLGEVYTNDEKAFSSGRNAGE